MGKKDKNVEIIARGVCIVDDLLLVCHSKGAENTFLPGGHVEFDESARSGLVREIEEEMGLAARTGVFLGAVEHTFMQKKRHHCEVNLVFELEIDGVEPGRVPEAVEPQIDFRWVALDDLSDSHLEPVPLRDMIPDWHAAGCPSAAWGSTYG